MKKFSYILALICVMTIFITGCSQIKDTLKKAGMENGKYVATHKNAAGTTDVTYTIYLTASGAFKLEVGSAVHYGTLSPKDGYRAAGPVDLECMYQAGTGTKFRLDKDTKTLYYHRDADNKDLEIKLDENFKFSEGIKDAKDLYGKTFTYTGKGMISDYDDGGKSEKRKRGDLQTTSDKTVSYTLKVEDNGVVKYTMVEDGKTFYYKGKVKEAKGFKVLMTLKESTNAFLDEKGDEIKTYAVLEPTLTSSDKLKLAIENCLLTADK